MAKWVFINKAFVSEEEASLRVSDLSFLRGYGIFEFFRVVGGQPIFLSDHLDRFSFSAKGLRLSVPYTHLELSAIIEELIRKNNLTLSGVRLSLTGGYSADGFTPAAPNLVISQQLVIPPAPDQLKNGIKLLSYSYQRQLAQLKTIDYLTGIWLQPVLKEKGYDDVLYTNNGIVTECPRSNFFMITKENVIVTPQEGILKGITRMKILEAARPYFMVEERPVKLEEIRNAQEAFVTSTTKQLLPVRQIDDVILPGRGIAKELLQIFRRCYC